MTRFDLVSSLLNEIERVAGASDRRDLEPCIECGHAKVHHGHNGDQTGWIDDGRCFVWLSRAEETSPFSGLQMQRVQAMTTQTRLVMPWGKPQPVMPGRSKNMGRYYGSGRDWETPPEVFDPLNAEFNFTLDVCAKPETAKVRRYFTEAEDGLRQSWAGEVCWMNPPYGREIYDWTAKALAESRAGATVVGLLPASTDLEWWHRDVLHRRAEIRYIRGRVRFLQGERWVSGMFPSVVVVWRP